MMFEWARAAGLPMLGGYDVYAYYRDISVRAHFWEAGKKAVSYTHLTLPTKA